MLPETLLEEHLLNPPYKYFTQSVSRRDVNRIRVISPNSQNPGLVKRCHNLTRVLENLECDGKRRKALDSFRSSLCIKGTKLKKLRKETPVTVLYGLARIAFQHSHTEWLERRYHHHSDIR